MTSRRQREQSRKETIEMPNMKYSSFYRGGHWKARVAFLRSFVRSFVQSFDVRLLHQMQVQPQVNRKRPKQQND